MLYTLAYHSNIIVSVFCPSLSLVSAYISQLSCLNCRNIADEIVDGKLSSFPVTKEFDIDGKCNLSILGTNYSHPSWSV